MQEGERMNYQKLWLEFVDQFPQSIDEMNIQETSIAFARYCIESYREKVMKLIEGGNNA
jgi:hypothetical protein